MKKILLSIAVVIFTAFSVNAQSFTFSQNGVLLSDTVTVYPDTVGVYEIVFNAAVTNNTGHDAEVVAVKNLQYAGDSSHYQLCWAGVCMPPNIDTVGPQLIVANGTSAEEDLGLHYIINVQKGVLDVSEVELVFYDQNNPSEVSKIFLKFDTSLSGIDENTLKNVWMSDVYPNPATNYVSIDYKLPNQVDNASIKIVNILGSVVKEQNVDIQNNSVSMDISNVKSGIYFYSLTVNGELYSTKKLIVR